MAVAAPEQVNAPVRPVYWTQFPAAAIAADWADPEAAHKAVMRLFPQTLAGAPHERRLGAGILFRIDNIAGEPTVLIQSMVPVESMPAAARSMTVTDRGWSHEAGDKIALRVAVNPVIRGKEVRPDGTKRDVTRGIVKPDDIAAWLAARTGHALSDLTLVSHFRDSYTIGASPSVSPNRGPKRTLVIDTIDALATVTDGAALDALRREGVGRSKSYGCGLITARRAIGD